MPEDITEDAMRISKGDRRAFEQIVDRYEKKIFNMVYRMVNDYEDAMDITQTAFMKAYDKLDYYDPNYKLFSWLYRIAVNEAINFIRKRKRTVTLSYDPVSRGANPEETLARSEQAARLEQAITELKPDYRVVIVLRHFMDLTYGEISEILEIPLQTVKSRLFTGRQQLRDILIKQAGTS
jgi:RNA polymerase sigma-70 factor (ECF subfamily)